MEHFLLFPDLPVTGNHPEFCIHLHSLCSLDNGAFPLRKIGRIHMLRTTARDLQRPVLRADSKAKLRYKGNRKIHNRFIRSEQDKYGFCRITCKILPLIMHFIAGIGNLCHCVFQIQLSPVSFRFPFFANSICKLQFQISQRKVGFIVFPQHIVLYQPLRLFILS